MSASFPWVLFRIKVKIVNLNGIETNHNAVAPTAELDFETICQLQCQQAIELQPIFFARVVYCQSIASGRLHQRQQHREVMEYDREHRYFNRVSIDYLRSEQWLLNYPTIFNVEEVYLEDRSLFAYFCPIGYRNNRPEYIQAIADRSLSERQQKYLQRIAIILDKYREIHLKWDLQAAEAKKLQSAIQTISHQLRNAFASISLYAHNLHLMLNNSPVQEQAQIICEEIQNLDLILTESIDCSQSQGIRLAQVDLRELVVESIRNLAPLIQLKQIEISIPETSTCLSVDRLKMKQVFDNIFSNAIHFSPDSGTITCRWHIFQKEISISIADEGSGLSPEDLQKVFTPFYSRREGGTGLGLTIAKNIILEHGGSLSAQNLPSKGAQFLLILPL
jgi:signal transduction histidine kinase